MSSILACTDGSLYAASIYEHSAWASSPGGRPVHVLHVIEREDSTQPRDLTGSLGFDASAELMEELVRLDEAHSRVARLRGKAILKDAEKQLREAGVADVTTTQRHGSLVETLREFENGTGLVVIGKRGEHVDFAKGHLGSNLERVVRSVHHPVLVAARAFKPIKRVMIAFDGGPSALKAIAHVAADPRFQGLMIHLIAVGKEGSELERELDNAATGLRGAGLEVSADFLQGDPEELITRESEERKIDLLVMGAYGHSRIRQLVIGSTTTAIIRTCAIPLLLFR